MPARAVRIRVVIAAAAITAALVAAATVASAASNPAHHRLIARCVRIITGQANRNASAAPGSANPQVAGELSIFRVARTARDSLPAADGLGHALAAAQATSYDPSASVRLDLGLVKGGPVWAVPASLAAPVLPSRCAQLHGLAALRAAFALRAQAIGSGPGVCLVGVQVIPAVPPVSILPGKRRATHGRSHTVATANCESLAVMASYLGASGAGLTGGPSIALVPDGVSSVTYTFSGGRQLNARVNGNLVTLPASGSSTLHLRTATRAKLLRVVAADTPATVTETDTSGATVATYTRPPSLVPEIANELLLLRRLVETVISGSQQVYAACSARTHRCVAAVVSTSCNARHHRCTMHRALHRYRYVGRRPPRGTTGGVVVPSGRIAARVSRYVARPGRVSLVLGGAPEHRADVVVATTCYSGHGATGSTADRRPLQVAVPSRTRIATVPRHRACAVNVLVTSSQRGPIHARLVRG